VLTSCKAKYKKRLFKSHQSNFVFWSKYLHPHKKANKLLMVEEGEEGYGV
jgi:hypothetical protein